MHPFVALMRRYVVDYLLCQDPTVCAQIMEPDYVLHMADVDLSPRDEVYVPAVVSQFGLFPGMGMTVHNLVVNEDRLAMRFSQHGASTGHGGRLASWSGIGLYRWNGTRLTSTFAIEDYESRRLQLAGGSPRNVDSPMIAPWDVQPIPSNGELESTLRQMVLEDRLRLESSVAFDDEAPEFTSAIVDAEIIEVDDMMSSGQTVAFKSTTQGVYTGGLDVADSLIGSPVTIHAVGLLHAESDGGYSGHVIRSRGPARRSLLKR